MVGPSPFSWHLGGCALPELRPRDVVVVWKLDRLSRSPTDLLHLLECIVQAGTGFRSLTEAIDTTTPAGRMLMQMVGSFAEFERAMMRECTQAGLLAARAHGRIGGRRPKLGPQQQAAIVEMVHMGRQSQADAARLFRGIRPPSVASSRRIGRRRSFHVPRSCKGQRGVEQWLRLVHPSQCIQESASHAHDCSTTAPPRGSPGHWAWRWRSSCSRCRRRWAITRVFRRLRGALVAVWTSGTASAC
jgi:hypothetical protein